MPGMLLCMDDIYSGRAGYQQQRFMRSSAQFNAQFGGQPQSFISAPGRSELGGNHTDHQHGCVLTAAVDLDTIAAVSGQSDQRIDICSDGYAPFSVDLGKLVPDPKEAGKSSAIVRGVAAGLKAHGFNIGGFKAYVTSDVLPGSGLSSSASFEVLIGAIFSHLYNEWALTAIEVAKIGQYAENEYFGKPCGLQDQMACALGGVSYIDFTDTAAPVFESITFDLRSHGYALCITNTGSAHDNLTKEYAAIPQEMGCISKYLGQKWLRFCDEAEFIARMNELRTQCGDRAVLRALHFFRENKRPQEMAAALKTGDFNLFLQVVKESGRSSWEYLQNVSVTGVPENQPVGVALAVSERLLEGCGAWRVHGGGFAGTIQAYVPDALVESYKKSMEDVFGSGCCYILNFRPSGIAAVETVREYFNG
jgi:galactokinase